MATRLAIVGCSSSKHDPDEWGKAHPDYEEGDDPETIPLKYLYKRPYWIVKRRYGRTVPDDWRILSAGLGLAHPDREMEDTYDKTLNEMSEAEIRAWINEVEPDVVEWIEGIDGEVIVDVLLGSTYRDAIMPILEDLGVTIVEPFQGTNGNGQQMQVLNHLVDQYREGGNIDLENARETLEI